jgi:hypothetical protein
MITFAKITAIAVIVLGILVMLGSIGTGVAGAVSVGARFAGPAFNRVARPAAGFGFGLFTGIFIFANGLLMMAIGQILYLLTTLAMKSHQSPELAAATPSTPIASQP